MLVEASRHQAATIRVCGHLREEHSSEMAQRVAFKKVAEKEVEVA